MLRPDSLLLRNRDFRLVWFGQILSQAGSRAYFINLLWWMVSRPGGEAKASLWSGALLVLIGLPSILFVKLIGKVLSTVSSRKILITAELMGGLFVAAIFCLEKMSLLTPEWVLVFSFLVATCQAFVDPALINSVPELVDKSDVESAIGFESSTQALAFFSGAALGAFATGLFGFANTIALNIGTYLLSAVFTSWAVFRYSRAANQDLQTSDSSAIIQTAKSPAISRLLWSFAGANFFMFPIFLILPLFIQSHAEGGVMSLGLLEACFWLGLILGAYMAPKLAWHDSYLRLCGLAYGVFGLLLLTLSFYYQTFWMGLVLAGGGFSAGFVNVKVIGYFQTAVPLTERGAFFAKLQAFVGGSQPLSYLVFTMILAGISARWGFLVAGTGLLTLGVFCLSPSKLNASPHLPAGL